MADHDRAVLDGHVDRVAFIDPRFERHRLGQAQPQAVAPFCDLRCRSHVSTLNIHLTRGHCQSETPRRAPATCATTAGQPWRTLAYSGAQVDAERSFRF